MSKFNPTNYSTVSPAPDDVVLLWQKNTNTIKSATVASLGSQLQLCETIAALKAVATASLVDGATALVNGYHAAGDEGGGSFYYDQTSGATDNGGTVIAPNSGTGRWLRVYDGAISVKWFGAKGDDTANDTVAIQAAADFGGTVIFPPGTYLMTSVEFRQPVKIQGGGMSVTHLKAQAAVSGPLVTLNVNAGPNGFGWGLCDVTIDMSNASVAQDGLKITGGVNDAVIERVTFVEGANALNLDSCAVCSFRDLRIKDAAVGIRYNGDNGAGNNFSRIYITGSTSYGFDWQRTTVNDVGANFFNQIIIEGTTGTRDIRVRSTNAAGTPVFMFGDTIICDSRGISIENCEEFYVTNGWFGTSVGAGSAFEIVGTEADLLRFVNCRFIGGTGGDVTIPNNAAVTEIQFIGCRFAGATRAFTLGTTALTANAAIITDNYYFSTVTNDTTQLARAMQSGVFNDGGGGTVLKPAPGTDQVVVADAGVTRSRAIIASSITLDADAAGLVSLKVNGVNQIISSGVVPATAASAGIAGQVEFDSDFIYRCIATNTWKRAAISTW